jgi:hypothetical protein
MELAVRVGCVRVRKRGAKKPLDSNRRFTEVILFNSERQI